MQLRSLSDDQLKYQLETLVRQERKITAQVLDHINEMNRRGLHLLWGYDSLFSYLTKSLGYSESAAYRRIQAARATAQIPQLRQSIQEGKLKLSQITQVTTEIRKEESITGQRLSIEQKATLFEEVQNKSKVETQKILDARLPNATELLECNERHKQDDSVVLTVRLPADVYGKLKRVQELYSHVIPDGNWIEVIERMADEVIKRKDPLVKRASKKDGVIEGKGMVSDLAGSGTKRNEPSKRVVKKNVRSMV